MLVTTGVTGGLVLFMSAAFLYYKYYLLAAVIAAHEATPRVDEDPKKALQANGQLAV